MNELPDAVDCETEEILGGVKVLFPAIRAALQYSQFPFDDEGTLPSWKSCSFNADR